MKIALVQPKIDEKYGDRQGYASTRTPPETGLAVLSTYLRTYASEHDVVCIDPVKTDDVLRNRCPALIWPDSQTGSQITEGWLVSQGR